MTEPRTSSILLLRLHRLPLPEHLEHSIGDDEATEHIRRAKYHRYESQRVQQRRICRAGDEEGSQNDDAVDRVGAGHERRMQHRRNSANHFEADEDRHDEDVDAEYQLLTHFAAPAVCRESGCMPSRRRVGLWRTSPSATMHTASMMSSPKLRLSSPLGARRVTSAARFLAYI